MEAENIPNKTADSPDSEVIDMEAVSYMRALIEFIFDTWEKQHSKPSNPEKA